MNWMTFIVDLTRAAAWPLVVGIAAWRLAPKLSEPLGRFLTGRQWKASGFGVALEAGEAVSREVDKLEESVARAATEPAEAAPGQSDQPSSPVFKAPYDQLLNVLQSAVGVGYEAAESGLYRDAPKVGITLSEGNPVLSIDAPSTEPTQAWVALQRITQRHAAQRRLINPSDPRRPGRRS